GAREAGAKLHAPRTGRALGDAPLEFGDEQARRLLEERHQRAAGRPRRAVRYDAGVASRARPVLGAAAGDRLDVVPGLARQGTAAGEPVVHPARTGIVGRGREPEIAEFLAQLLEKFRR